MTAQVLCVDDFLPAEEHRQVWSYLNAPGWTYGAYSRDDGSRYFFKHYAGYQKSGANLQDPASIEAELGDHPTIANLWSRLKRGPLASQGLARCYANGMPMGAEGGVHLDSNIPSHLTAIYYPHLNWDADFAGETLFFTPDRRDLIAAVFPKPNRLVIFPGTVPHVARPVSLRCPEMRVTLMFKTSGPVAVPAAA